MTQAAGVGTLPTNTDLPRAIIALSGHDDTHVRKQLDAAEQCAASSKLLYNGSKYGFVIEYNNKNVLESGLAKDPVSQKFVVPLQASIKKKVKSYGDKHLFLYKEGGVEDESDLADVAHCLPVKTLKECDFEKVIFRNKSSEEILSVSVSYLKTLL